MLGLGGTSRRAALPGDEVAVAPPTSDADDAAGGAAEDGGDAAPSEGTPRFPRTRAELFAAAEILGLTGLAFARPILDAFGRAPEMFLARGAGRTDLVLFALAVTLVPAAVCVAVGVASRALGPRVRAVVHLVTVGVLATLAFRRFGGDVTKLGPRTLWALAVVAAAGLVFVRRRSPSTGTYLRLVGAASVVFLVQFLVFSPASSLGGSGELAADAGVGGTTGQNPPIVMIVVDALPTASLLDGTGHIDAELYPNFAALAGEGTWYRNYSTVSAFTFQAVPAMLTGKLPRGGLPNARTYPDNLFTLFARTHRVEAVEQITRLCPTDVCSDDTDDALPSLLSDAVGWWRGGVQQKVASGAELMPGVLEPDRGEQFVDWVDDQDFGRSGAPGLWFYHLVMPHEPWNVLDDQTRYEGVDDQAFGLFLGTTWTPTGADVALQRQILQTQAVDAMLGELFDRLREAGTFDDSVVVVVGDHGEAFLPDEPRRGISEDNEAEVAWTPLIVKWPGQQDAVIDDSNVWSIDLVPTIAEGLGIDLDWDIDGVPASETGDERDDDDKRIKESPQSVVEGDDEGMIELDGRAGLSRLLSVDLVAGQGVDAVWQRTPHGALVGQRTDDLAVGDDADGEVTVSDLDRIEDAGDLPMLEFIGHTTLAQEQVVAVAVNGVVAAVAPVSWDANSRSEVVHALLRPDSFGDENSVTAFLVDGPVGAETLRPLRVSGD